MFFKKKEKTETLKEFDQYEEIEMKVFNDAFDFFLFELGLEKYRDKIDVKIDRGKWDSDVYGYITPNIDRITGEITGASILLRPVPMIWGQVECLAHEMIHAKQYFSGQTQCVIERKRILGLPISTTKEYNIYYEGEKYHHLPYTARQCEAEARSGQTELAQKFFSTTF